MKRLATLTGVLVVAGLLFASGATAERPERSFLPADDQVISGACSFDVAFETLANNEFGTLFGDGRFLITGKLKTRVTNLDNPAKWIDLNISGPGVVTSTADGGFVVQAWGVWLFWFLAGDLGPGSSGMLVLTKGPATLAGDAGGNLSFAPARNTTDLCALLA